MEDELLIKNARTYALAHQSHLAERLGFGIHGIVFIAEDKLDAFQYRLPGLTG